VPIKTTVPLVALLLAIALGAGLGCDRRSNGLSGASSSTASGSDDASHPDPLSAIRWDEAPLDWSRPVPETPPGGVAQAGYVGSEACKGCHRDLYDRYARHSMARTGIRPLASLDAKWLGRIFDAARPVQHERSGYWYRPYRDGKKYFMEEYLLAGADGGARVQSRTVPLEYAYSAGSYGVAFYFRQGGRFYQVPLDFYPQADRWGVDPGAREGNPRFSKVLESFCISCHTDYPRSRAGTDQLFIDPVPTGVGCERCHGPGERHAKSLLAADIVNPARLPAARQLDVCAQCHESHDSSLRADRGDWSYRPGEPFAAYRVNFVGQPPEPDRFILLAHPERMVESACWKGSAGKMVCTSCHDPHKSSFDQPASWWDGKCATCHADKACTETAEARAAQGGHCVSCHMRRGPPTSPTLVTVTDHWIQRRPPPVRPGSEQPARIVAWPDLVGDHPSMAGADLAALQGLALAREGKAEELAPVAVAAANARVHLPALYQWLAGKYLQKGEPRNVALALATVLRFDPDSRPTLLGYARTMLDRGDPVAVTEAMHALDRLLALDADDPDALETKATTLFRAGQIEGARPLFARAAALSPSAAMSHVALAALARREGRDADAVGELEAARALEPGDPWILDALAALYSRRGDAAHAADIDRARKYFAATAKAPSNASRWLPETWR
jgi:Flp pilus assembly protein TadD